METELKSALLCQGITVVLHVLEVEVVMAEEEVEVIVGEEEVTEVEVMEVVVMEVEVMEEVVALGAAVSTTLCDAMSAVNEAIYREIAVMGDHLTTLIVTVALDKDATAGVFLLCL